MGAIYKAVDGKPVGLVDGIRPGYFMNHRTYDNIRVDYCEIENRATLFHEIPSGLLSQLFARVVSKDNVLLFYCLGSSDLDILRISLTTVR
jgi:hypothetical protein